MGQQCQRLEWHWHAIKKWREKTSLRRVRQRRQRLEWQCRAWKEREEVRALTRKAKSRSCNCFTLRQPPFPLIAASPAPASVLLWWRTLLVSCVLISLSVFFPWLLELALPLSDPSGAQYQTSVQSDRQSENSSAPFPPSTTHRNALSVPQLHLRLAQNRPGRILKGWRVVDVGFRWRSGAIELWET